MLCFLCSTLFGPSLGRGYGGCGGLDCGFHVVEADFIEEWLERDEAEEAMKGRKRNRNREDLRGIRSWTWNIIGGETGTSYLQQSSRRVALVSCIECCTFVSVETEGA